MATFTIVATRLDATVSTIRLSPAVSVAKARDLAREGWKVVISDEAGQVFRPSEFDRLTEELVEG